MMSYDDVRKWCHMMTSYDDYIKNDEFRVMLRSFSNTFGIQIFSHTLLTFFILSYHIFILKMSKHHEIWWLISSKNAHMISKSFLMLAQYPIVVQCWRLNLYVLYPRIVEHNVNIGRSTQALQRCFVCRRRRHRNENVLENCWV